jgi:hypothetical protein
VLITRDKSPSYNVEPSTGDPLLISGIVANDKEHISNNITENTNKIEFFPFIIAPIFYILKKIKKKERVLNPNFTYFFPPKPFFSAPETHTVTETTTATIKPIIAITTIAGSKPTTRLVIKSPREVPKPSNPLNIAVQFGYVTIVYRLRSNT